MNEESIKKIVDRLFEIYDLKTLLKMHHRMFKRGGK